MKKPLAFASFLTLAALATACGGAAETASTQSSPSTPEAICTAKNSRFTYKIFNLPLANVNTLKVDVYAVATGKRMASLELPESGTTAGTFSKSLSGGRVFLVDERDGGHHVTHQVQGRDYSTASCR